MAREGPAAGRREQYAVKRKMLESASEAYVLINSSKFDFMGISLFVDFSELTGLVTSKSIRDERLNKLNLKIVYAGEGEE